MKNKLLLLVLFVVGVNSAYSQGFDNELGVTAGLMSFQSDYGESGDFKSTKGKTGFNIGLVHYMDFSYRSRNYFQSHFKIKTELTYSSVEFKHFGRYSESESLMGYQLRAMTGSTRLLNLGAEFVWFPFSVEEFNNSYEGAFAPYLSIGIQYNHYRPTVESDLGPVGYPSTTPVKFIKGHSSSSGSTFSFVAGIGTRYKLSDSSDIFIEARMQKFFSDWVDGLNPDKNIYKENKSNDFTVGLNLGYVYKLN